MGMLELIDEHNKLKKQVHEKWDLLEKVCNKYKSQEYFGCFDYKEHKKQLNKKQLQVTNSIFKDIKRLNKNIDKLEKIFKENNLPYNEGALTLENLRNYIRLIAQEEIKLAFKKVSE